MTPGSRLAAAAEILSEILAAKAAADRTIVGWGKAHRFAGSKDRAAIAERVYAVLRRRNECAFAMGSDRPRARAGFARRRQCIRCRASMLCARTDRTRSEL
jgi:16S rRNA (cytosine967-C5)-methyltransferase